MKIESGERRFLVVWMNASSESSVFVCLSDSDLDFKHDGFNEWGFPNLMTGSDARTN